MNMLDCRVAPGRLLGHLAGIVLLAAPAIACASEYTLLIRETPAQIALRSETGAPGQRYWSGYARYGKTLADAGILRGGAALQAGEATRSTSSASASAAQGMRDVVGGYFVIDVANVDAALDWARRLPATADGATVDVLPVIPNPVMH